MPSLPALPPVLPPLPPLEALVALEVDDWVPPTEPSELELEFVVVELLELEESEFVLPLDDDPSSPDPPPDVKASPPQATLAVRAETIHSTPRGFISTPAEQVACLGEKSGRSSPVGA